MVGTCTVVFSQWRKNLWTELKKDNVLLAVPCSLADSSFTNHVLSVSLDRKSVV